MHDSDVQDVLYVNCKMNDLCVRGLDPRARLLHPYIVYM